MGFELRGDSVTSILDRRGDQRWVNLADVRDEARLYEGCFLRSLKAGRENEWTDSKKTMLLLYVEGMWSRLQEAVLMADRSILEQIVEDFAMSKTCKMSMFNSIGFI